MFKLTEKIRLIAAAPDLSDPNFKHTIVLVIENIYEGAFGFIINRESQTQLNEIYDGDNSISSSMIAAWEGGPVDDSRGFLMIEKRATDNMGLNIETDEEDILHFSENIKVVSDTNFVKEYLHAYTNNHELTNQNHRDFLGATSSQDRPQLPFKFLMGYSGWEVDQLDEEIAEGLWIEVPYNENLIFNTQKDHIWRTALASVGLINVESYQVPESDWLN